MEGRESNGPSPFNSFYHRTYTPNPNLNTPNSNPTTNAVFTAPQRAMLSPEQSLNIVNNNNTANASASSPLYSEGPTAIFSHPGSGRASLAGSETLKRKRGRPRKYGTDVDGFGNVGLGLSSPSSPFSDKKGRGSGKKAQMVALGCAGHGFIPHVITIAAGEDVCKKIMDFMQHGPWAVCVLSANGAISNVTLRQPAMSGGTVTYEGRFEILSLSGSFLLTDTGGTHTRTGGLSVSLAGSDGRVIGGGVGGLLMAASPVQVVVGTFLVDSKKDLGRVGNGEPSMGTLSGSMSGGSPSPSIAVQSRAETSAGTNLRKGGEGEQNTGGGTYNMQPQVLTMMSLQSMDWGGAHFEAETKSDTETALTGRTKPRDRDDGSRFKQVDQEEECRGQNITFEN